MKTIKFCKDCMESIGRESYDFLYKINQNYLTLKSPSFIHPDCQEYLELARILEEKRYIVTHEIVDEYIAVLPLNIEPKVFGCHLHCKNREEEIEETNES